MTQEVFDLNPEQQKAFNRLKKAYKDCEKLGVLFVNIYGRLEAYDKKMVNGYGDNTILPAGHIVDACFHRSGNEFKITNEWADDSHVFGLTDKGLEKYRELYGEE